MRNLFIFEGSDLGVSAPKQELEDGFRCPASRSNASPSDVPSPTRLEVEWRPQFANDPSWQLWIPSITSNDDWKDVVFTKRGTLYWGLHEPTGQVRFYSWRGTPDRGFGGSHYPLKVWNDERDHSLGFSEVVLIGPWSSAPSTMNEARFPLSVDVAYRTDEFNCGLAGNILLARAHELFAQLLPDVELRQCGDYPLWIPHPKSGCITDHKTCEYVCPVCNPGTRKRSSFPDLGAAQLGVVGE